MLEICPFMCQRSKIDNIFPRNIKQHTMETRKPNEYNTIRYSMCTELSGPQQQKTQTASA